MASPMPEPADARAGNRLAQEISPYLRQHAAQPVHWQPWDDIALAEAARRDCPIFLSLGYASCHWCHVMAHESFEDPEIAALLNAHFVAVKVDREERPDLDDIYMMATQLLTGRGGWPNSVWLTPDGRPWFAGTYFPPRDRSGAMGFLTLLERLAAFWRARRREIEEQADALSSAIRRAVLAEGLAAEALSPEVARRARDLLLADADRVHGGFGHAPKFPPHNELRFLLDVHTEAPDESVAALITRTLDAMAGGGIRDVVGGGFHRYSTDERWHLPHFEKMLTDNAELLDLFAQASARFRRSDYADVAREIGQWLLREMEGPDGGFCAGLDADSAGVEGAFYVWTTDELRAALGPDSEAAMVWLGARPEGNYQDEATGRATGANVLSLSGAAPSPEKQQRIRGKLFAARERRVRPARDDKVVAAWNGRAIGALARAAAILGEPDFLLAAERAASFVWDRLRSDGRLRRIHVYGRVGGHAFLDDYALLGLGLLDLSDFGGASQWRAAATELAKMMVERFTASSGAFQLAPHDRPPPVANPIPVHDHVLPSGNAAAVELLARLTSREDWPEGRAAARRALGAVGGVVARYPRAALSLLRAARLLDESAPR